METSDKPYTSKGANSDPFGLLTIQDMDSPSMLEISQMFDVRRVPENWNPPKQPDGGFTPLFDRTLLAQRMSEWDIENAKWAEGFITDFNDGWLPLDESHAGFSYVAFAGERPLEAEYTPSWQPEEATHYRLFAMDRPASPALPSTQKLAEWLATNHLKEHLTMNLGLASWVRGIGDLAFLNKKTSKLAIWQDCAA